MPNFGKRSRDRIATLDPRWSHILDQAIGWYDFTVICGHRDIEAQTIAFETGASTKQWPNSKHNVKPSLAVDIAPWHSDLPHIRWKNEREFVHLAGVIQYEGHKQGVVIRWLGDMDGDQDLYDQSPWDIGHFEIRSG